MFIHPYIHTSIPGIRGSSMRGRESGPVHEMAPHVPLIHHRQSLAAQQAAWGRTWSPVWMCVWVSISGLNAHMYACIFGCMLCMLVCLYACMFVCMLVLTQTWYVLLMVVTRHSTLGAPRPMRSNSAFHENIFHPSYRLSTATRGLNEYGSSFTPSSACQHTKLQSKQQ